MWRRKAEQQSAGGTRFPLRAEPGREQGVPRSEEHLQLRQTRWDGNLQCVNLDYDPDPRFVGESASDLEEKSETAFG